MTARDQPVLPSCVLVAIDGSPNRTPRRASRRRLRVTVALPLRAAPLAADAHRRAAVLDRAQDVHPGLDLSEPAGGPDLETVMADPGNADALVVGACSPRAMPKLEVSTVVNDEGLPRPLSAPTE